MKGKIRLFFFIFSLLFPYPLLGEQSLNDLLQALEIAAQIDKKLCECFPVTFNHIFSTGYLTTHSARMTAAGSIGLGIAHAPPYLNWNGRIQPFSHLELSANYRVFLGCEDPVLGPYGFGDHADRGANFKFAIFSAEESLYHFPGIAIGIDDFMGSKKFTTYYIVGTQVLRDWGLEGSVGWGAGRYTHGPSRGFFGGLNWFPLWDCPHTGFRGIGISVEYDPTNYKKDPHPLGKISHTPLNFGIKYTLCNWLELSGSYLRGEALAASGSLRYNWGKSVGLIPKIGDPLPYTAPVDTEPLGCYRPTNVMIQEMHYALEAQGFRLTRAWIGKGCHGAQTLWLRLINCSYRQEHIVRMRLQNLLAALTPSNITDVVVIIESYGFPCQQYTYNRELLLRYASHCIGSYEFDILTPRENACPPPQGSELIFRRQNELLCFKISPRFETFFGNARGKFKYDLGVKSSFEGLLPYNWFYEFQCSYTLLSTLNHLSDFDFLHPSQLPNVATDYVRYRQQNSFTWDTLYLQKNWNFGRGYFGRVAGGYFQVNYGGIAGEVLWYPPQSCFAIGLAGAIVKKRSYAGFGFQSTLREFNDSTPVYHPYSTLQQFFLDFYLDFPALYLFSKISVGQFLARDKGVRLEVTRYFDNGLRLMGWITFTDAFDIIHGETYFDRGIALELPLDLFYKCSNRRVWNYATAAWLRDAGYATSTGKPLFNTINRERRW
jgi:hypothetical protein